MASIDRRISIMHISTRKSPIVFIDKTTVCPICKTRFSRSNQYGFKKSITGASRRRLENVLYGKMNSVNMWPDGMSATAYID